MLKRGVLVAYLFIIFIFTCQYDQLVGCVLGGGGGGLFWQSEKGGVLGAGTARKGGLRCGSNSKKGGLRCGSVKKGGSLPRHIPILNIYVSTPPPPPPPGSESHPSGFRQGWDSETSGEKSIAHGKPYKMNFLTYFTLLTLMHVSHAKYTAH